MAWYEAHQTLAKHPKTLKLASLLKVERRYAVGLLHDLFSWALDSAKKDGTLPGIGSMEIAAALDFMGKKGESVVNALVESGYIEDADGTYKIHDWYDYAGKLIDKRENDKRRKNEWRERGRNAEGTQTKRGNPLVTVPNRTVPDNNNIHITRARAREGQPEEQKDPDGFEAFWEAYPRKTGDTRTAYVEYLGALQNGAKPEVLIEAAKAMGEQTKPDDFHFLPAAEKWLRNKGWLEQEARKKVNENGNGKRDGAAESGTRKQFNVRYDVE